MSFGSNILKYKQEILNDLDVLIAIPSCAIHNPQNVDYPYGKECKTALEWILNRAQGMNLITKNINNYAGHAEYGEGEGYCAVLTHLDVVPGGDGWRTNPFSLIQKNSKLFGRGVVDDKGPAIISLYCLKALKDQKIVGKRKIRTIFGSGEEVGMKDMGVYFKSESLPDLAFTPDSCYGICNREKGSLKIEFVSGFVEGKIKKISSGTVANAVPGNATAILDITQEEMDEILKFLQKTSINYKHEKINGNFKLEVFGVSAHASQPSEGKNAAAILLDLLGKFFENTGSNVIDFLNRFVGIEIYGESMGIAQSDKESGPLTLNFGVLKVGNGRSEAVIDIRYPVTSNGKEIVGILTKNARIMGVKTLLLNDMIPMNVSGDSKIVRVLKKSYKEIVGENADVVSTGGGSYARTLKDRGVSFGPTFKTEENGIHQANESMSIEKFFLHAQICLEAMKKMLEF
ncbi:MAG: Sapep family Mn(2+)-dependent dipeptidase [Oscillospiraceae bacterium]|nr:Sapep family Mn(2+)-dependent dipeptidase [Oscillospiraceae bacterium]